MRIRSPEPEKPPGTAISPTSFSFARITPLRGARSVVYSRFTRAVSSSASVCFTAASATCESASRMSSSSRLMTFEPASVRARSCCFVFSTACAFALASVASRRATVAL